MSPDPWLDCGWHLFVYSLTSCNKDELVFNKNTYVKRFLIFSSWHWILTVIDPHSETVYVLDSLYNKTHVEEWKSVVEMAMKVFNMSTHGKRTRQNMIWNVIKCPQQPDGKQCGFYVMRFMKDIIENCGSPASMSITLSFDEGYYSKKEIDEVRTEWAEFVHDFID